MKALYDWAERAGYRLALRVTHNRDRIERILNWIWARPRGQRALLWYARRQGWISERSLLPTHPADKTAAYGREDIEEYRDEQGNG
jgi:hypothetical protein